MRHKKLRTNKKRLAEAWFSVDSHWRITAFSKRAERLTGLSAADVVGKDCRQIFEGGSLDQLCQLHEILASGHALDLRLFLPTPFSPEGRAVFVNALPRLSQEERFEGAVIFLRDLADESTSSQHIVDSVADGMFTVDRNWHITSFNRAAEKMTGYSRKQVLGMACRDIFHSSVCGEACILKQSIETGRPVINRSIFIKNSLGKNLPVSISASPLVDAHGNIIGGVETFRDLTSTMEKDLILDSIADGVFTVDTASRITSFNHAAEEITGYAAETAVGKPCREVFQSSICGEACAIAQSMKSGEPVATRAVFIKRADGRSVPISISAAPLMDHEGNVIGGVETFRDQTAIVERDLILDSIADGVFTVDRNGHITSFNRAAEEITGWSARDAMGKPCREVFQSSICGEACAIAQSMKSGEPVTNMSIFIEKADGKRVPISISAAPLMDHEGNVIGGVETFRDLTMLAALRKQISQRYTFGDIVSKSAAMQRIFDFLPDIARSDSNVLILGESGTGKELVARAIHTLSGRKKGPFVAVNCGALPDTLLESELFGYKAGAFTDAKKDRPGRFAAAEKGTLFLDEIGDISPALQVKLLRVLQSKVYEPLGSTRPVKADVRILAATNRDLATLVKEDRFREDLFYRLNVVKIQLPPLRERMEDLPLLVDHFVEKFNAQQGRNIAGVSEAAMQLLMRYDFPGNIRELENIIEYAFILCREGFIEPEHLPEPFAPKGRGDDLGALRLENPLTLEEIEKSAIYRSLERNNWRRMATCRELGISKDTLRRKIERYGLKRPH